MSRIGVLLVAGALFAAACSQEVTPTTPPAPTGQGPVGSTGPPTSSASTQTTIPVADTELGLDTVASGFAQPVLAIASGGRLFVVDQPGQIWVIDGGDPKVFLDIRDRVSFDGEQGLLSVAFHPGVDDLLYVNYTGSDGSTVVAEYRFDAETADPTSERIVLRVDQPARNHNGGMIAFGPDGNLWIGMGDGGGSDDRFGQGQRGDTLLGAMLRIEVGPEVAPYRVVADNGFEAPEVWAIGLRNPWRFAFDGRDLWIADVGQNTVEEINRVSVGERALNFGWPIHEGNDCFAGGPLCGGDEFTYPVHEYRHPAGCSITGGYVYRGKAIPQLDGHYFFSDFCSGFLRSIAPSGAVFDWTDQTGTVPGVTSFGIDSDGELLVVSAEGTVYRVVER